MISALTGTQTQNVPLNLARMGTVWYIFKQRSKLNTICLFELRDVAQDALKYK